MDYPYDVELIAHHRRCGAIPAWAFTASCACGHEIGGHICESCSQTRAPGCLTCWKDGTGHQCPAELAQVMAGDA
jgi:hypothetical protein